MASMLRRGWTTVAGIVSTLLVAAIVFAQDQATNPTTTTTTTTSTTWYTQWWIWAVGVAVFLIIVIALTNRGGTRST